MRPFEIFTLTKIQKIRFPIVIRNERLSLNCINIDNTAKMKNMSDDCLRGAAIVFEQKMIKIEPMKIGVCLYIEENYFWRDTNRLRSIGKSTCILIYIERALKLTVNN